MAQVGHLNSLVEKYYDKGLRVVAISDEAKGTVEAAMIGTRNVKYWLGSDTSKSTQKRFSTGGVSIPRTYLIDANGMVIFDGMPSDQQIESALENAYDERLGKELHKSLKGAVKSYEKGDIAKARSGAAKLLEHDNAILAGDAKFLHDKTAEYAAFRQRLCEGSIESKDYGTVYDDLSEFSGSFAGMEIAAWAAAKKKELDADPAVKNELSAWKAYLKAKKKHTDAGTKDKKLKSVRKAYESLIKKYPGTRAAEMAKKAKVGLPR